MSKRIRRGDKVGIIAGDDKGKKGEVLSRNGDRVIVQGVNICKKHQKAKSKEEKGGIIEFEKSIHISNVRLAVEDQLVKLRARVNKKGEKELFYKVDNKEKLYRLAAVPAKA